MKNKGLLIGLGVLVLVFFWGCNSYNGMSKASLDVKNSWAKVQSAYQQRADLIPNLVETVKGAADFEKSTLVELTNARARATSINIDPANVTPEQMAQFQAAQSQISTGIGRLLAVVENYPALRATENFKELQSQLEGQENRIRTERNNFNDAVNVYNKRIITFPSNLIAGMFKFSEKPGFAADAGSDKSPKVKF